VLLELDEVLLAEVALLALLDAVVSLLVPLLTDKPNWAKVCSSALSKALVLVPL